MSLPKTKRIRVLVRKEASGSSTWSYVAVGIEEFVTNQGEPNDENWSSVVDGLGDMLDLRDQWLRDESRKGHWVRSDPPAPLDVAADWEAATPIGERPLGSRRVADLRMGARRS